MASTQPLDAALRTGIDDALAYLRTVDSDAAADLDHIRVREVTRPRIVVVGETKRGKSSLVNMLLGVPGLSPVDAVVATAAYLEFSHGEVAGARAYVPGQVGPVPLALADLPDWSTLTGRRAADTRPPRRIEVTYPAPLLRYLTVIDTPGTGGLEPVHAEIALDAVSRATALLYVVDASAPFTEPELRFLVEASKTVNVVVFVLAKIDAYPGWRTVLAANRAQLRAYAPRFGSAAWFPVSARLAELALTAAATDPTGAAAEELLHQSGVAQLQHALIHLAGRGHLLAQANLLRSIRSELVGLDQRAGDRIRATDPDPAEVARLLQERSRVAARKRSESRQWSLSLNIETQRARVEATARLRTSVAAVQEHFTDRIDTTGGEQLRQLPQQVDDALHALSIQLSADLEARFRAVGERVLAEVFNADELHQVLRQLNARLRHTLATKPRRDGPAGDNGLVVLSSAGVAMMAGRGAALGASALGLGAGLIVPVVGVGLGLAAAAFLVWKRKVMTDRQQARIWLREVLAEARAALGDEIMHRFTDLQYALTLALDEAIERRVQQLDAQLAAIEQAMAQDKAERGRRRADLVAQRDALRARVRQVDDILVRVRQLEPAEPAQGQG
ncbi:MAG TPA: dynamin family protein [Micromonosporaceae bacterium]|nr:dynamin family protein [Micromonosporaceae bacterium]